MRKPLRRFLKRSRLLRRITRRVKNAGSYWPTRLAITLIGSLSLDQALRAGERIGATLFRLARAPRRQALHHLQVAFGDELSESACVRLARASFVNLARCFCEVAKMDEIRTQLDDYVEVEGVEHLREALRGGRGALVITGHVGNWELLAAHFALHGFRIGAIARRIYEPRLNQLIVDLRAKQGVRTILRESPTATRDALSILKEDGVLAMLIDQDTRAPSISVPFLGRLARTPAAAASLAIRRDLPVMAIFIQRRPVRGHRIVVQPPFERPNTGDSRSDIRELAATFNRTLEAQIRKNPAEGVWWQRRGHRAPIRDLDLDQKLPYAYSHPGS
jgi:KDO2-lipid IV(A) lauroyltransferase